MNLSNLKLHNCFFYLSMFSPVVFTSFFPHKYVNVNNLSFQLVSLIIACTLPHHSVTRVVSVLFFLLLLTQFFSFPLFLLGQAKQSRAQQSSCKPYQTDQQSKVSSDLLKQVRECVTISMQGSRETCVTSMDSAPHCH